MVTEGDGQLVGGLGFARFHGGPFIPARRLASMGPTMVQVDYLGLGVVSTVTADSWVLYTPESEVFFSQDKRVDQITWKMGMEGMKAAMVSEEGEGAGGPPQLQPPLAITDHQAPGAARKKTKLSRIDLQHNQAITEAAMAQHMVEHGDGSFSCHKCPTFKTRIPIEAKSILANIQLLPPKKCH